MQKVEGSSPFIRFATRGPRDGASRRSRAVRGRRTQELPRTAGAYIRSGRRLGIRYSNVQVPELDQPVIELTSDDGISYDLYNEWRLRAVVFSGEDLSFGFESAEHSHIRVSFIGVRGLSAMQPEDWVPEEADQIDHLHIRPEGPWRRVVFQTGGLTYEFDAECLGFVEDAST